MYCNELFFSLWLTLITFKGRLRLSMQTNYNYIQIKCSVFLSTKATVDHLDTCFIEEEQSRSRSKCVFIYALRKLTRFYCVALSFVFLRLIAISTVF